MYDVTKDEAYLKTVITVLNEDDNGGESVVVTTHVFDNEGDSEEVARTHTITTITLHSYGRSAELNLGDVLDKGALEEHLEKLADIENGI